MIKLASKVFSHFFVVALLVAAVAAEPQSKTSARPERVRSIAGVDEYRLPNGLQVLLYPDSASATVTVNITYLVGSRNESYGETGMAHLLEHLNFKGTPSHRDITKELSVHGADANATTSYDRTNYFETFPASPTNLEWALGLEADRMVHSFIAQKDLDSEMTVVRNEFESGENDPSNVLSERVLETAYLWHNYGHPTIGSRSDIEHVPVERLQAFYHTYYQPDNASLIVAGNFNEADTLRTITRTFGSVLRPTRKMPELYTEEPTQDGEREITLRRAGGVKVLILAYHIPADAHADTAALSLLTSILSDAPSGRLYKRLVENKLATRAIAEAASLHDPSFLLFSAVLPQDGDLERVRAELSSIIDGIPQEPFTQAELDRARNQELNRFDRMMNSSSRVAEMLSENVAQGDWRLLFWDRDQMKKVSPSDFQRVATRYLVSSNVTVGRFIPILNGEDKPTRAAIPQAPAIAGMLKEYAGGNPVEPGEHLDPALANLEARTQRGSVGAIKTAFLEKKTRGARVSGALEFHFGNELSLEHKNEIGIVTAAMLMRGTRKHSRLELEDELTRLNATLDVSGGPTSVSVHFEAEREKLLEVLRLVAEVLKEPAFPASELDEIKRARIAGVEQSKTDPESIANRYVARYLSPYSVDHFRYVPTFEEEEAEISQVDVENIRDFHRRFYGVAAAEAVFVGSFDSKVVAGLIAELFGDWKSPTAYQRVPKIYKPTLAKTATIVTPDKANAVVVSEGTLDVRDDDRDYPSLVVGNQVLGGGFLSSRLATRIRQKDGLSYSVESGFSADSFDKIGLFGIWAICAPQNAAKVERDVEQEIARALAEGFTAREIEAAKAGILEARIIGRSSDHDLAGALARQLYLGRDFHWDEQLESRIRSVSPDQVQEALRREIDPKKMITVKAGDFGQAAEQ